MPTNFGQRKIPEKDQGKEYCTQKKASTILLMFISQVFFECTKCNKIFDTDNSIPIQKITIEDQ